MDRGTFFFHRIAAVILSITAAMAAGVSRADPEPYEVIQDEMAKQRRRLIDENLALTPEEAKQFWPLYREFEKEIALWRKSRAENMDSLGERFDDNLSKEEAQKVISDELALEEARLLLYRRGFNRLKNALPGRKLLLYFQIEHKINTYTEAGISDEIPLLNSSGTSDASSPSP